MVTHVPKGRGVFMGSAMKPHCTSAVRFTLYGLSEIAEFIATINCHHHHLHQERASADWYIASYIGHCQRVAISSQVRNIVPRDAELIQDFSDCCQPCLTRSSSCCSPAGCLQSSVYP